MPASATALEVELLGGVARDRALRRDARLRPLTGRRERRFDEIARQPTTVPRRVTEVLCEAVEAIGGQTVDEAAVGRLCVADRQWLMLQLGRLLDGDVLWTCPQCVGCGVRFDAQVDRGLVPTKLASPGFPYAELVCEGRSLRLRVPTGDDQQHIAELPATDAKLELIVRCLVCVDGGPAPRSFVAELSEASVSRIDAALDEVAPDVGTLLQVACPECGLSQLARFDPYPWLAMSEDVLISQVHALASHYHWSEAAILSLPRERRHKYLRLIEREHGVTS